MAAQRRNKQEKKNIPNSKTNVTPINSIGQADQQSKLNMILQIAYINHFIIIYSCTN